MLAALASLALAGTLSLVSPTSWNITAKKTDAPSSKFVNVQLKNTGRATLSWRVVDMPVWADCWIDSAKPWLGRRFVGEIKPGATQTVRIDLTYVPGAFTVGKSYLADIAFLADGSTARETTVACKLTVAP